MTSHTLLYYEKSLCFDNDPLYHSCIMKIMPLNQIRLLRRLLIASYLLSYHGVRNFMPVALLAQTGLQLTMFLCCVNNNFPGLVSFFLDLFSIPIEGMEKVCFRSHIPAHSFGCWVVVGCVNTIIVVCFCTRLIILTFPPLG